MFEHITEASVSKLSEDEILSAAETLKSCVKDAEAALTLVQAEMTKRVNDLELAAKFERKGWNYSFQNGKKIWNYPVPVVLLEKQLKAAQEQAQADGSAKFKLGKSFWKIEKIKKPTLKGAA